MIFVLIIRYVFNLHLPHGFTMFYVVFECIQDMRWRWNHVVISTYKHLCVQNLGVFKERFPDVPLIALTATATLSVKEDVVRALKLTRCIIFRQTFNRPNLRWLLTLVSFKFVYVFVFWKLFIHCCGILIVYMWDQSLICCFQNFMIMTTDFVL